MHVPARHVLFMPDACSEWAAARAALAVYPEPLTITTLTPATLLSGTAETALPPVLLLAGAEHPDALLALRQLRTHDPAVLLAVVAARMSMRWHVATRELEAAAYLLWQDVPADRWPALLSLLLTGGIRLLSRSVGMALATATQTTERQLEERQTARAASPPSPSLSLTAREQAVAALLLQGWQQRQIARQLGWSLRSVERTAAGLRAKHGAANDICLGARLTGKACPCPLLLGNHAGGGGP